MEYGHLWTSQYPDEATLNQAMSYWARKLDGLTAKQMGQGMKSLPHDRPPTPSRFRELCRVHPAHRIMKALPKPKPNLVIAADAMAKLKALL